MLVDGKPLSLNNFVKETIGNIMAGFSKALKDWMMLQGVDGSKNQAVALAG